VSFATTSGVSTSQIANGAITTPKLGTNAATLFVGAEANYGSGLALAETASNTFTDWTLLGTVTVDFAPDVPEEVAIVLSLNLEGVGADTHVISMGLSTLYDELARVNQEINGAQQVTATISITVPWADLAPPSGSSVSFRGWAKIAATGTDVEAMSGYFSVLSSRK
jgi:hypothetical protein